MTLILTSSDLDSFLHCRRAWRWGYHDGFNLPDKVTGALALGNRVHVALEAYYRDGRDPLVEWEFLCKAAEAHLDAIGAPLWEHGKLYDDIIVGRNCIAAYLDWMALEAPDDGYAVEGVEEKLEAPILGGRVLLRGKIDLRMRRISDGALRTTDFKTSGLQMTAVHHRLERSYQPVIYDWLLELVTGEKIAAATFRVIKKVSRRQHGDPKVEEFSVPGALRAREAKRRQIERIATEMIAISAKLDDPSRDADAIAYPNPTDACGWCDYRDPCREADENPIAATQMLRDLFTSGPHERYEGI